MIIVCSQDPSANEWVRSPTSDAARWGRLCTLTAGESQQKANQQLQSIIKQLDANEALCMVGWGSDRELGDPAEMRHGWSWRIEDIAGYLAMVRGYSDRILIYAISRQATSFSAGLAVRLEEIAALNEVWVYGYNRSVAVGQRLPAPSQLDMDYEIQGTQVRY